MKLQHSDSYKPTSFNVVFEALSRLSRLQSLDLIGFHASSLTSSASLPESTELIERLASNLTSFRFTFNNSDRVENKRHPIFRTIIAHAPRLQALELCGMQKSRDLIEVFAAIQTPEKLAELRVNLSSGQTLGGLTASLNRLSGLEELSVGFGGGFEMACYPAETRTFGKIGFSEVSDFFFLSLSRVLIRAFFLSEYGKSWNRNSLSSPS